MSAMGLFASWELLLASYVKPQCNNKQDACWSQAKLQTFDEAACTEPSAYSWAPNSP